MNGATRDLRAHGGRSGLALTWVVAFGTLLAIACGEGPARANESEAVRSAVREQIRSEGETVSVSVPGREEERSLRFDHVHESVHETAGGRRVVCVDFTSPDGTVHDLDYYVDRDAGSWRVEDVVLHKVGEEEVLSGAERARLDAAE